MPGSIRGAVFSCQGIFFIEKLGLAMQLGKGGGAAPPFEKSAHLNLFISYRKRVTLGMRGAGAIRPELKKNDG